jgi:hypothetical protein
VFYSNEVIIMLDQNFIRIVDIVCMVMCENKNKLLENKVKNDKIKVYCDISLFILEKIKGDDWQNICEDLTEWSKDMKISQKFIQTLITEISTSDKNLYNALFELIDSFVIGMRAEGIFINILDIFRLNDSIDSICGIIADQYKEDMDNSVLFCELIERTHERAIRNGLGFLVNW